MGRAQFFLGGNLPPLQHLTADADMPGFELTFLDGGRTWKVLARGSNAQAAAHEGLIELAAKFADFNPETARLVAAVQTR